MNSVVFILLIGLVISQLVIFYLIILLNNKVAKFKDLEVRQDQLMQEMDNAIGVYLIEMREENDRLIEQLNTVKIEQSIRTNVSEQAHIEKVQQAYVPPTVNGQGEQTPQEMEQMAEKKSFIPKNMAASAYNRQKAQVQELAPKKLDEVEQKNISFEQQIVDLYKAGQSIEEIAKQTQKGKTEIELLLKFRA
ncbi:hypothetical protein [Solibacillus sp. CAU 1738]|uniref:hypothetical protein n=1 Tax=Solibacillus sp. CAU 1738 TaxID=3140363 RepID=UPI0032607850